MSKNNLYLNGAVHLDHSHSLEINQQNLSAEDLNRIIHAFMHGDASGHTEKPAPSPMPVYAEEVVCETDDRQESEALAQARQELEQARKQEAEALEQARRAQEQARQALEQARQAQEQARQAQAQAQTAQEQAQAQAQTAQSQAQTAQEQAQSQAQTAQSQAQTAQEQAQAQAQTAQAQAQTAQAQAEASLSLAEWLKKLIYDLRQEGMLKRRYDFTWVMWGVNYAARQMLFANSRSFLEYLTDCGIDQLPSIASLQSHNQNFSLHERPDQWTFRDKKDEQERQRRIRVGKFTIHSYQVNILANRQL